MIERKESVRSVTLEVNILLVLHLLDRLLERQYLRIYLRGVLLHLGDVLLHLSAAPRNSDFNQGVTGRDLIGFHNG